MPGTPDQPPLTPNKALLFTICLLPLAYLLWAVRYDGLGPEPIEFVQRWTGFWTFTLLLLTLSLSPLRALTGRHGLLRLRRMLGLFCFLYASLHLLAFIGFEHEFAANAIARGILKRPFTLLGIAALALLVPLAATSNAAAIRWLGGRRWQELHRSIYLAAILGGIHYLCLAQGWNFLAALVYAMLLAGLLGWRMRARQRKTIPAPPQENVRPLKFFPRKPD